MAKNQSKRLPPVKIEADESVFAALATIANYTPINPAYALEAVRSAHLELEHLRRTEAQAAVAATAARDCLVAKEWEFHNLMLGVKEQVIAQFGRDSGEVGALGLKRKSEYRLPGKRAKAGGETA